MRQAILNRLVIALTGLTLTACALFALAVSERGV
jgi:hypothetical protein